MMPPFVRAIPALALLTAPAAAQDDGGYYFEFGAGVVGTENSSGILSDVKFDTGYAIDVLLGHQWDNALDSGLDFGLELGAYFNEQNLDSGLLGPGSSTPEQFSNGGFSLGGVISWPYSEEISFYGGAAIGLATALDLDSKGDAGSEFSFQDDDASFVAGKLGVRYNLGDNTSWFLQYRRTESEDITTADTFLGQSFDLELSQNVFEVGVRWGL